MSDGIMWRCEEATTSPGNEDGHYNGGPGGIEPIEYIEAQRFGFHAGNVVKYVSRYPRKGGVEDLKKARWYLDRLIAIEEGGE